MTNTGHVPIAQGALINYIGNDDEADIPGLDQQQPIILLQATSPAVLNNDPEGARPGLYLGRLGYEQLLVPTFSCQLVGFAHRCPEFAPDQKVPIADHGGLPREAEFHRLGEGYPRPGYYLGKNQVVPTVVASLLVDHNGRQHPSALRFQRSSYAIGRELYARSRRLNAVVDGEQVRGCHLGKYAVASERDPKSGKGNFVPKFVLRGVVGEPAGPTPAEYGYASEARRRFRNGDDWTLLQPPEPPTAEVTVIEAQPNMVPEGVVVGDTVEEAID
jgi:hypothetical protein